MKRKPLLFIICAFFVGLIIGLGFNQAEEKESSDPTEHERAERLQKNMWYWQGVASRMENQLSQ